MWLDVSLSAGADSDTSDDDTSAATTGAVAPPARRNNTRQDHLDIHRLAFLEHLSAGADSDTSDDDTSAATTGAVAPPARRNNTRQDHLDIHRLAFLEQYQQAHIKAQELDHRGCRTAGKTQQYQAVFISKLAGQQAAYDHHAEKRRKRGSLFFRKKKDKSRKASHVWQAAGAGGDCDWCNRALSDKPSLYCENCTMTVHQNICKDYIVECNKPKTSKTSVGKSLSASSGKSSKRSSVSGQSQTNSTSHLCNDDKDGSDHKHDQSNASDEAGMSSWAEATITAEQLGDEALALGLALVEADTWAAAAPSGLARY
ncbi:unnamed protein product [Plutella xylostella]|uniref:(diamondback moth) hypothetical protein n=1 Tax=Plutella xylostella TaxID=51655 RepID=A0A8S4G455_PLUXY|nr:unnamed protein product [Plutella xylostella]